MIGFEPELADVAKEGQLEREPTLPRSHPRRRRPGPRQPAWLRGGRNEARERRPPPGSSISLASLAFTGGQRCPLNFYWGAWLVLSVDHATFDLGVASSSPTLGVAIT